MEEGYIKPSGRPTGKMFETTLVAQGEPGAKTRIPSKSRAYLTTYLQPYAHVMRAVLETDPTLHSGLAAGNQAWNLVADMSSQWGEIKADSIFESVLLGDLEKSTDFVEYEAGRLHMDSFWEPWKGVSDYFRFAHELILQPFLLEANGTLDISTRGALMGLPGTKIVLHTISKSVDIAASRTEPMTYERLAIHTWRCAGDDIIKFGKANSLRENYYQALTYRVKPSEEKWGTYSRGGKYCEKSHLLSR
jgi:hypothetical protein